MVESRRRPESAQGPAPKVHLWAGDMTLPTALARVKAWQWIRYRSRACGDSSGASPIFIHVAIDGPSNHCSFPMSGRMITQNRDEIEPPIGLS
jgi:hypothetical protein